MGISLYEILPSPQDLKMLMVHPLRVQVSKFDVNALKFCRRRNIESRSMEVIFLHGRGTDRFIVIEEEFGRIYFN